MKIAVVVVLLALFARLAGAQTPDTTRREPGATVSGIVRDSLAQKPLAGAVVQLVGTDHLPRFGRTTVSDSLGRFALGDVPDGRYTLGFFHPMLDSLGIEAPLRPVVVERHRPVRADLAIPSPAGLRTAICGPQSPASNSDSGAVILGVVRDALHRAPVAGASVTAEWLEMSFTSNGLVRRVPQLVATTGENGWFALCNVPSRGTVAIVASSGTDSTDRLDVSVPADGFLRRDIYLGPASAVATGDPGYPHDSTRADTLAPARNRMRLGNERLIGTVVTADGARPVVDAEVSLSGGPKTRTNERGEWILTDAPAGTRMLEVRALRFYPERRPVDVVPGGAPVRVVLSTLKAVLDTVRVSATRRIFDRHMSGFEARRRSSGWGHFLTPQDIARRHPIVTSDVFRSVSGMRLERSDNAADGTLVQIRGAFGELCSPSIYLDGMYTGELSAEDIDSLARPDEIAGIEIYDAPGVPAEFSRGMGGPGCGSVVIWTK